MWEATNGTLFGPYCKAPGRFFSETISSTISESNYNGDVAWPCVHPPLTGSASQTRFNLVTRRNLRVYLYVNTPLHLALTQPPMRNSLRSLQPMHRMNGHPLSPLPFLPVSGHQGQYRSSRRLWTDATLKHRAHFNPTHLMTVSEEASSRTGAGACQLEDKITLEVEFDSWREGVGVAMV